MSTFEKMLRVLSGVGDASAPSFRSSLLAAATRSEQAANRRSRTGADRVSIESLERRELLAIDVFTQPGFVTVVGEGGEDIFLQKVATSPSSMLVANNSSFVDDLLSERQRFQVPNIDAFNRVYVTSGAGRADSGIQPASYPMSSGFTTTFRLGHDRELGVWGYDLWEGTVSIKQPKTDGGEDRIESWHFTNGGDGLTLRLDSGIGVSRPAKAGDYYPTSVAVQGNYQNPVIDIRWNVPQLSQTPTLDSITWVRVNRGIGVTRFTDTNISPSAAREVVLPLPNAAGPGLGPIIAETFRGTLLIDGVSFDVGMSAVGSTALTFNGSTTGEWSKTGLADVQFTGQLVTGDTGGFRGLRLTIPSFVGELELTSARYAVSTGIGKPVSATVFAGHDLTNSLDINLLQPGSSISIDSPVRVAASRPTGISLRASEIELNARTTTAGRLDIGAATGSNARAFETVAPVAEIVEGRVERLVIPSGLSGAGYDPDNPPTITIEQPKSIQATAMVDSLSDGKVASITLRAGGGGTGYTSAPTVTVSPPRNGRPATATAVLQGTSVSSVQVTDSGSGYTSSPTVTFFSVAGTGAAADANIVGSIGTIRIVNGGFGYAPNTDLPIEFRTAGVVEEVATGVARVGANGSIEQITVTKPGKGYSLDKTTIFIQAPPPNTSPDVATARAIVDPVTTRIVGFEMLNKGSGYGNIPQVTVAPPSLALSAPRPVATLAGDRVTAIRFQSGTGLNIRVNSVRTGDGAIQSVTVPGGSGGVGYAVNDLITLDSSGTGTGRSAVFQVMQVSATGAVSRLQIVGGGGSYRAGETLVHSGATGRGYGYDVAPRVFIDRPAAVDGRLATAEAIIDAEGRITEVKITDSGSGYDPARPPLVTIDQLTPLAVAETVSFNAGIGAGVFDINVANDLHTKTPRSTMYVSATASLSANEFGTAAADSLFARVASGDVIVSGTINVTSQSFLLQSESADQSLLPFVLTTENPLSRAQTGLLQGATLAVTMANDLPTPQSGASAFNTVAIQTRINSLRVRAARRNGTSVDGAFPYELRVTEADALSVDAVAASSFPVALVTQGNMVFTSAISTAGGMLIDVRDGTFTMTAPISTTKGQLLVSADQIDLRNSLSVTKVDRDETTNDVVLTARNGDVRLNGGGVTAVNRVIINQKNRRTGSNRSPSSVSAGVLPIGDFQTVTKTVTFEDDFVFDGVNVDVGITHSDLSDLAVTLIAPDGSRISLVNRNARGANFTGTVFSSDPSTNPVPISRGTAPYTGTFESLDSLAVLHGRRSRGVWTLEVRDGAFTDTGSLDSFNLRLHDPNTLGNGLVAGSSRITADTLEIDAEGSVGNPSVLPGDPATVSRPGYYLRTDVNVVNARVDGSFSLHDVGAVRINALQPGGPVSLRADGVDPVVDASGRAVVPTILAVMTDVNTLDVTAPRGSVDVRVNTAGSLSVGNPAQLSLDASVRNEVTSEGGVRVPAMRAAGGVSIRTQGGAAGGDIVVRDAPLAGTGELRARYAISAAQLGTPTYVAGTPGIFPSTLTAAGNQSLAALLRSEVRVGDRILVTGASAIAHGLYTVASVGDNSSPWRLFRAAEADTAAELKARSIVTVSDGTFSGQTFRINYDETQRFALTPMQVNAVSFSTSIGSDDPNDLLTYVVSTTDGTNNSSGSLGKMIGLRQSNNTGGTPNPQQKSDFRFSTGIASVIRLEQELPAIAKAFAIDGSQRYPTTLTPASPIVLDGSRIRTTRYNVPVLPTTTVDAFTVRSTAGNAATATQAASLANMTVGGFAQGAVVNIQGAQNVVVAGMSLGLDAVGRRLVNRHGVLIAADGAANASGTTIKDCTIVGASAAGVSLQAGVTGITLVGNTIGKPDADNVVGVDIQSGVNRLGVPTLPGSTVAVGTTLGRNVVVLPATASTASVYLGQKVIGTGIALGTVVAGISGQAVTLSLPMTVTGSNGLSFETAGRNLIQNNLDGILLAGTQTTVANSRISNNTFDGIRITNGVHIIGTTAKVATSSNEIWGNGRWGLNIMEPPAVAKSQRVTGNYFSSSATTTVTANRAGNVAVNGIVAAAALGYVPNVKTGIDLLGNQHFTAATVGGTTAPRSVVPIRFPWRPRR